MDWIKHLDHLQTVFKEFDFALALNEKVLICHFYNSLRFFIWA